MLDLYDKALTILNRDIWKDQYFSELVAAREYREKLGVESPVLELYPLGVLEVNMDIFGA